MFHQVYGKTIQTRIWDTRGEDHCSSIIARNYYGDAHGALLVYDITNRESFENIKTWLKELQEFGPTVGSNAVLIGNKSDLTQMRAVSSTEGLEFADQNRMFFVETSALNGTNVDLPFRLLLQIKNDKNESCQPQQ